MHLMFSSSVFGGNITGGERYRCDDVFLPDPKCYPWSCSTLSRCTSNTIGNLNVNQR